MRRGSRRRAAATGPVRVLLVTTKQRRWLEADTWVHVELLKQLDRSAVDARAACAPGPAGRPTPTHEQLREVPGLPLVLVDLGSELDGGTRRAKARAMLGLGRAAWGVVRLACYIRRERIEVVHTTDRPRDAAVCVLLARVTGARSLVHVHVGFDPGWMRRSLQWAIRHADALVAVSDYVAGTLIDGGCDPASVHVVHNGIDPDRWTPAPGGEKTRRELGIDVDAPVVLTACRLFRSKGVSELVQAMGDLVGDVPDAVLVVAGRETEGGYLAELEAQADSAGVGERVRFLGQRDDLPALMAAADVFAMPSDHEPFGLVFAEAMAMELPVVGLRTGGTVEVVEDGRTGLLAEPGDRAGLAAALRTLLLEPDLRAELGRNGRRRVEERFTTVRMAQEMAAVLQAVARPSSRAE
jgi:glycosyltransferase involved in cell wall biosynthesis